MLNSSSFETCQLFSSSLRNLLKLVATFLLIRFRLHNETKWNAYLSSVFKKSGDIVTMHLRFFKAYHSCNFFVLRSRLLEGFVGVFVVGQRTQTSVEEVLSGVRVACVVAQRVRQLQVFVWRQTTFTFLNNKRPKNIKTSSNSII